MFISIFLTVFVVYLVFRFLSPTRVTFVGLSLLLIGGFTNFIDRIKDTCVSDPLVLFGVYFNVSDVLILVGLFVIIVSRYDYLINRR